MRVLALKANALNSLISRGLLQIQHKSSRITLGLHTAEVSASIDLSPSRMTFGEPISSVLGTKAEIDGVLLWFDVRKSVGSDPLPT